MGYSGYSLLFFPFAGRTNLHQPHINSAVEYAEELAADMETIAARIDREAEQKAAVAAVRLGGSPCSEPAICFRCRFRRHNQGPSFLVCVHVRLRFMQSP